MAFDNKFDWDGSNVIDLTSPVSMGKGTHEARLCISIVGGYTTGYSMRVEKFASGLTSLFEYHPSELHMFDEYWNAKHIPKLQ
ncbi:hypothetical protein N7468_010148 [Penicillium chermesinum]|uniref:Uncharacterized protein n=1 Tax=Penicillium chermesinum TaxID=63820 RepID=A0A9W9NC43_9EURO|nr:uncharacterized protein N7468_010148 [Penicillium chermesinum]KAJ5217140.1 hypothetical protein N7468_010148 [Penicillium chermesinum]